MKKVVEDVIENGPWMIRNVPIILKPWTLNTNLLTNIPVSVKSMMSPLLCSLMMVSVFLPY